MPEDAVCIRGVMPGSRTALWVCCLFLPSLGLALQDASQAPDTPAFEQEEAPLPGDWGPDLLYAILNSPNPEAGEDLLRAAFAAGQEIIPKLEAALKDDRTAEFAAQSLAFIGGEKALDLLWKLQKDPRDLNLRRFYYGALGEYDAPEATQVLLDVIRRSDSEPDRTVTEAAILALTLSSDLKVVPRLKDAAAKLQDVVIRDDVENAVAVIQSRAKFLATPEGKKAGGSIEQAVRTYFYPALQPPPPGAPPGTAEKSGSHATPVVKVEVQRLTFSPDKSRALARVIFEDPTAVANYDMILQKRYGNWMIASVWLGTEAEKAPPPAPAKPATRE
ncbi:MAG TPA: hypothetical protein VFD30_10120 [Terriglobia bacterium]|jgi:hypothetical protein|nr:hypothetical protein [Terriglobia bacterium]